VKVAESYTAHRPSLHLLIGAALSAVLGYALWFLLARTLTPDVVGASGVAVSLMAVVSLLSVAGIAPTILAGVGTDRIRGAAVAGTATLVAGGAGVVIGATVAVVAVGLGAIELGASGWVAFVVAGGVGSGCAVLDAVAIGAGRSGVVLLRIATLGASRLGLAWLVASVGGGVDAVLVAWACSVSFAAGVSYVGIRRRHIRLGLSPLRTSGLIRRAGWNQVVTVAAQAPGFLLPVIVAVGVSASANAGYYLAWQIAGGCFMIAASTTPTLLARAAGRAGDEVALIASSVARLTMGLLGPAVLGVVLVGPIVLDLLGNGYGNARWVLWVFAASAFPDAYTSLAIARLRAEGRERRAAALNATMGVITIIGALVLVPVAGSVGAAIAFAFAQSVGCLYWLGERRRDRRHVGDATATAVLVR
jgi:O-antigen/teichoic acid export membrane protein